MCLFAQADPLTAKRSQTTWPIRPPPVSGTIPIKITGPEFPRYRLPECTTELGFSTGWCTQWGDTITPAGKIKETSLTGRANDVNEQMS